MRISVWFQHARAWAAVLMKPALFLVAGLLLIVALGLAQRLGWVHAAGSAPATHQANEPKHPQLYICPMMCTPPLSEPGRCPVCGMELVPLVEDQAQSDTHSIQIDPASRRVANIQTVQVRSASVSRTIRTIGELAYDEGRLKTLAAYVNGRLDRLYVDYTGAVVNQGDVLAKLYSPQLYTAQAELLAAQRSTRLAPAGADSHDLAESARRKLLDLGMTERQISMLEETKQPTTRIDLVAPIQGTVITRLASEGDYVKTGQAICRLADLSTVWLMLELFPEDAAAVHYGQHVSAEVQSLPGREFSGRVAFVDPTVDPKTRTVGVRVVVANEDGLLKVGDYATARIHVPVTKPNDAEVPIYDPELAGKWISPRHPHVVEDGPGKCPVCGIDLVAASKFGFADKPVSAQKQLVVPRNAVLAAGDNSVVYVETEPGRFGLRRVELGPRVGSDVVIVSGLAEGETVATNGNFLIDSQMQLSGKPSLIDPEKAQPKKEPNPLEAPEVPPLGPIETIDALSESMPSPEGELPGLPPIGPIQPLAPVEKEPAP